LAQVALSADFLKSFAAIPRKKQKKVRAFIEKFRIDPTMASINYEPIHDMRDDKVRTVRIDLEYRAIVIQPPQGDVYLLVWVDHHDEAMRWAKNKTFEVNPRTGSFQVFQPVEGQDGTAAPPPAERKGQATSKRLLSGYDDDTLLLVGVPEALLPAVRALYTEGELDDLCAYLPSEAADALVLFAAGCTLDETLAELDRKTDSGDIDLPAVVDTQDFAAAMSRPESKRHFKVVEDAHELADILNAPLAQWRVFLHPSQERLVRLNSKGPIRVLGGAGTGKTVVAMHRARHLARDVFTAPDDRILFTTFTRNLAADIQRQLRTLCGAEMDRIEVANLNSWASRFLRNRGVQLKVVTKSERDQLWERVYERRGDHDRFSLAFYKDEWEAVVQAFDVTDLSGYLRARRAGRGTRLTRKQRKEVWAVLEAYRNALDDAGRVEQADVIREARLALEANPSAAPYQSVVADETQDFRPADLMLLRALVPEGANDLLIVGDAHQRIYGHKASLSQCGINVRGRRSRRLKVNYRTTQKIATWAVSLLRGLTIDDLDEGSDSTKGYRALRTGAAPQLHHARNADAEADFLVKHISQLLAGRNHEGEPTTLAGDICVVVRRNHLIEDRYRRILEQAGIPMSASVEKRAESVKTAG
jgi:hypothetical protein